MRNEMETRIRRARDRELVRTLGAVVMVVGGGLLHTGFVSGTMGIPWLALGAALFTLGVVALRVPDVLWVASDDPEPSPMAQRDETG